MRRYGMGLFFTLSAALLAAGGLAAYLVNTVTESYAELGVDNRLAGCLGIAAIVCLLRLVIGLWGNPAIADILPPISSVLLASGLVTLFSVRVDALSAAFAGGDGAPALGDTMSCFVALVCCAAAYLNSLVSAFLDISVDE